ncbi:progonadoliberin-1 isoform X2 [Paroedura picta]
MGKVFTSFLLLLICGVTGLAQHWSYGLQPGGKRDTENLIESFQEIANEVDKPGEPQRFECTATHQHPTFQGLKGALASLMDRETGQKKI